MARESKRTRDERRFGKLERLASRTERPADTAPIRKLLEAKRSP